RASRSANPSVVVLSAARGQDRRGLTAAFGRRARGIAAGRLGDDRSRRLRRLRVEAPTTLAGRWNSRPYASNIPDAGASWLRSLNSATLPGSGNEGAQAIEGSPRVRKH